MAHFEIKHPYTVIQPFWAVSTAVHTVKASKKNLRLRLRHSRNRKPTVYVRPIPITVWRAPLTESEYIAATYAAKEALWLRTLISQVFSINLPPTTLFDISNPTKYSQSLFCPHMSSYKGKK